MFPNALFRTLFVSLAFAVSLDAANPITTGNTNYIGPLTSGINLSANSTQGPNVKIYLEQAAITLAAPLSVDRIGPDFGTFATPGSGSGALPAGTQLVDYLLHYDRRSGDPSNVSGTITFSGQILGLILFDASLNQSDAVLGVAGVTYFTGQFRGIDNNTQNQGLGDDEFSVTNNKLTFNIDAWSTTNAIDEVRILVAVPEPATFVAPVLTAVVVAFLALRRHTRVKRVA